MQIKCVLFRCYIADHGSQQVWFHSKLTHKWAVVIKDELRCLDFIDLCCLPHNGLRLCHFSLREQPSRWLWYNPGSLFRREKSFHCGLNWYCNSKAKFLLKERWYYGFFQRSGMYKLPFILYPIPEIVPKSIVHPTTKVVLYSNCSCFRNDRTMLIIVLIINMFT